MRVILIFIVGLQLSSVAQNKSHLCLKNENVLFAFLTNKGKKVSICIEKKEEYIVYRFGKSDLSIELQYPQKLDSNSWNCFSYGYYLRGGRKNEAMDINELLFEVENVEYRIYSNFLSRENTYKIGVNVLNTDLKGNTKSQIGSLIELRENKKIQVHELF